MSGSGSKKKSRRQIKRGRKPHLDNRDLAHKIKASGFKAVAEEIGDRMTPSRAHKIVELMTGYGYEDIDGDLMSLAGQKKQGHFGGHVKPPAQGEVREYQVGVNSRIGLTLSIMGKKGGDKTWAKFENDKITVFKSDPRKKR